MNPYRRLPRTHRAATALLLSCAGTALAGGVQTLEPVEVTAPRDGLIGRAETASEGTVTARQLEQRPLLRPAEVLEVVPGLVISQHSGDGKANQYYLRGFNLDHGTDFATTLLGMPINLPTHGHGQGYSDLQFLIPELVERMQYRKGTYAASVGDFATAGSASIEYFRSIPAPFAELTLGQRGYRRALVAGSPSVAGQPLLVAVEWTGNDGPWDLPEDLNKRNAVLRYSFGTRDNGGSVALLGYRSDWDSTDQVPQRAIDSGQIGRFGNLDPSDGGRTQRISLSGDWSRRHDGSWLRANAYLIDYDLDLWSNFTFCLDDIAATGTCDNGDQFHQVDRRKVYGGQLAHTWFGSLGARPADLTLGLQARSDRIDEVGLRLSTARRDRVTIRNDRVDQTALALYAEGTIEWTPWLRSTVGLRGDQYEFDVASDRPENSGKVDAFIASPKLGLALGPWARTEFYVNAGYGFHSNDARGTTIRINPDPRDPGFLGPIEPVTPLVRAKGYELGVRSAPWPGVQTSLALWRLDIASELVFIGDAGSTEASFPSRRSGIEWATYLTPTPGLIVDADLALSKARLRVDPGLIPGDRIPGALGRTFSLGVAWDDGGRFTAGARLRHFGPRPLVEDDSVRSRSSTTVNAQLGWRASPRVRVTLEALNLLDAEASDIDYYYTSQLRGEPNPVDDVHTHPAEPRTLRVSVRITLP